MNEEPTDETENLRDTGQLITEIEALISRIELLRIRIALYLLLSGVSPQRGETPDSWYQIRLVHPFFASVNNQDLRSYTIYSGHGALA